MILIADNVISPTMANYIQNFAIKQMNDSFQVWGKTKFVHIINFVLEDAVLNEALQRITKTATKYYGNVVIDWAQMVEWPVGANQQFHLDSASDKTVLSSITYLNSNFRGGETIFSDGTKVAPVIGRTVFFDGTKHEHGVYTVNETPRYTIPIWYKAV
jgi:hypothetical protein